MRRVWPIFLLFAVCSAGPATAPEDPNAPAVILRDIQHDVAEKLDWMDQFPSIGERKFEEVLVLDYDGPALTARTQLTPRPFRQALTLAGMPGSCVAWLRFNRAGSPMQFHFERLDTSDPEVPFQFADVTVTPGMLLLSQTLESVHSVVVTQLVDDRTNLDPSGHRPQGECRLYIQAGGGGPKDNPSVSMTLIEGDMRALLWAHRAECDVYLRPMLRELGQERLMLLNPSVARQVLAVHIPVSETVAKEVRRLVRQLDSDDFNERRSATAALKKLGLPAAQAMTEMDRSKLSPEQHNRVNELIDANRPVSPAEIERLGNDRAFLIDCLELNDDGIIGAATAKLERITGKKLAFDPKGSAAERTKALDALRNQLLPHAAARPSARPATQPS